MLYILEEKIVSLIDKNESQIFDYSLKQIDIINQLIRDADKYSGGRAKNLPNVAITFNNALNFISHDFKKKGIDFYDNSSCVLKPAIISQLSDYHQQGLNILQIYVNTLREPSDNFDSHEVKIFSLNQSKLVDLYYDTDDKIFSFNVKDDIVPAVINYIKYFAPEAERGNFDSVNLSKYEKEFKSLGLEETFPDLVSAVFQEKLKNLKKTQDFSEVTRRAPISSLDKNFVYKSQFEINKKVFTKISQLESQIKHSKTEAPLIFILLKSQLINYLNNYVEALYSGEMKEAASISLQISKFGLSEDDISDSIARYISSYFSKNNNSKFQQVSEIERELENMQSTLGINYDNTVNKINIALKNAKANERKNDKLARQSKNNLKSIDNDNER